MGRFGRFSNYLAKGEDGLAYAGAGVVMFMMVYTVVGVATRYAGMPIKGFTEYVTLIFVWAIMFAISYAQRRWEHLSLGIVMDRLAPRHRRLVLCVLLSFGIFICVLLTWSGLDKAIWAYQTGDELLGAVAVTTWWSRLGIPIGISIACVRLTVQLVQVIRREI
ncbi:MAG: TRAP transporter small permease [Dehalococcoidia bacterium]|nr:MAG: TRAP transporter small permease [Dehalococcoidia bacterium]